MAKRQIVRAATSVILEVFIRDSSSTTGAGLTGLVFNSGGLTCYYHRNTAAADVAVTLVTMTVGTFTSSGFKEVDATNMPGVYQLCLPDAAYATGAQGVVVILKGAANMVPVAIEIELTSFDIQTAIANSGDAYARLGAPVGASVSADIATVAGYIDTEIADIRGRLPAALVGGRMDTSVGSYQAGQAPLQPAVAGRALDVSAAGKVDLIDKTGFALDAAQRVKLDAAQPDYAPAKAGDAMTLTSGERTAIANEVETQIIDETDSEKVLQAITDKIAAANPDLAGLTLSAIASAVWGATTRSLTAFGFTVNTNANATELAIQTAISLLNNLSAAQARTAADDALLAYDAPTNAEMIARTLPSASYALEATLTAIKGGSWSTETLKAIKDAVDLKLNASAYTAPDNNSIQSLNTRVPADPADQSDLVALLNAIAALLTPEMANVDALVTKLNTMLELSGSDYRFTAAALVNAPSSSGSGGFDDDDRDMLTAVKSKTDLLLPTTVTVSANVTIEGNRVTMRRGTRVSISFNGLGSLAGRSALYFTSKWYSEDADSASLLQIKEGTGLLVLNGQPATGRAGEAGITVIDENAGDLIVELDATASDELATGTGRYYDIKVIMADGPDVRVIGPLDVVPDITRALT